MVFQEQVRDREKQVTGRCALIAVIYLCRETKYHGDVLRIFN